MQNGAILLSRIVCSELNISTRTALSPQDHWSIPLLNTVPYWHWLPASLHSRLSICLINPIYLKHTKRSISMKVDLMWPWSSDNAKPNMYIVVCDDRRRLQQPQWNITSLYLQGVVCSSSQKAPSSTCRMKYHSMHSATQWDKMDNSWTQNLIIFQEDGVAVCADTVIKWMNIWSCVGLVLRT